MNAVRQGIYLLILAALLSGCGFQLRGSSALAPAMERVQLKGVAESSALGSELRQALTGAGAVVVSERAQATAVLTITTDQFDKRVLSVDSQGQASEYELHYRLGYELRSPAGDSLVGAQQIDSLRDYVYDPANVLGKGAEEEQLKREMRRVTVYRMLERLSSSLAP